MLPGKPGHQYFICVSLAKITQYHSVSEQGVKLLGLLLAGSTGQHMAGRNGLA
jgi:hypothetical protein